MLQGTRTAGRWLDWARQGASSSCRGCRTCRVSVTRIIYVAFCMCDLCILDGRDVLEFTGTFCDSNYICGLLHVTCVFLMAASKYTWLCEIARCLPPSSCNFAGTALPSQWAAPQRAGRGLAHAGAAQASIDDRCIAAPALGGAAPAVGRLHTPSAMPRRQPCLCSTTLRM